MTDRNCDSFAGLHGANRSPCQLSKTSVERPPVFLSVSLRTPPGCATGSGTQACTQPRGVGDCRHMQHTARGMRRKGSSWSQWRTRLQPIRTSAEIRARIKILPVREPHPYQRLASKVAQLRALGMTYQQIADALNICENTAMRAFQHTERLPPSSPLMGEDQGEGGVVA